MTELPQLTCRISLVGEPDLDMRLSEADAGAVLGVSRNMLCIMRQQGRGPNYTIEGKRNPVYKLRDVLTFAQQNARVSWR